MLDDLVLGAGVAGLLVAHRLTGHGQAVRVLEAAPRAGGLVASRRVDGMILEQGPQTLQSTPEILEVIDQLDLVQDVWAPAPDAGDRFVLHEGRLLALPHGPAGMLGHPLLPPATLLRILAEPLVPRRRAGGPETVHAFISRRLGPAVADGLVDPFIAGVFGGDPRVLEVDSAFPDWPRWARDHGSFLRGAIAGARARAAARPPWAPRVMFTLAGGLQTLVEALEARLGDALALATPAEAVTRDGDHWRVDTPHGPERARRLWVTTPLEVASRWFPGLDLRVPRSPIAAVTLAYRREALPPLRGFGWLSPSHERADVLGCLWSTSSFPGLAPGHHLLRVMVGGTRAPALARQAPDALIHHARCILRELQGVDADPVATDVVQADPGIPQYPIGHASRLARWQAAHPGLRFVGWSTTGVGVSHTARAAATLVDAAVG